ncbi:hypothetical protein B0H17DRAFT_1131000 [Mycena rosella]|uniref:Uncharacterized protein n=1 Tax=Mycena rosella TaxID=1033263 RepID=A0AAD7DPN2_MYCRO|nr:hypothetical protein B0H17DRAFT_1131000 [Mycena rosella]
MPNTAQDDEYKDGRSISSPSTTMLHARNFLRSIFINNCPRHQRNTVSGHSSFPRQPVCQRGGLPPSIINTLYWDIREKFHPALDGQMYASFAKELCHILSLYTNTEKDFNPHQYHSEKPPDNFEGSRDQF